jgi:hypothetical protein
MIFSPVLDVALEHLVIVLRALRLEPLAYDVMQAMSTHDAHVTRHRIASLRRYVEDRAYAERRSSTYGPDQDEHRRMAMVASRAEIAMEWLQAALHEETEEAADGLAAEALELLAHAEERVLVAAALAWREGEPRDAQNVVALVSAVDAYVTAVATEKRA